MTIVADSSVLIALSKLNRLYWLHDRFPEGIIIPPAVWREVVERLQNEGGFHLADNVITSLLQSVGIRD